MAGWYEDTDPKSLEVFIELHRDMTPGQRAAKVVELVAFQEGLRFDSVRLMYPHASEHEVFLRVAVRRLDRETFGRMEVPFLVGGSLASSTHGLPRQTSDIDVLADLGPERVEEFCGQPGPELSVDESEARRAAEAGRAFNGIHRGGAYRFVIFPVNNGACARSQIRRRRYARASIVGIEHTEFPLASAEDTILSKLVWYRKGGETSGRQWNDFLGVSRLPPSTTATSAGGPPNSAWLSLRERAGRSLQ
jgi:hypothetical protein